MPETILIFEDSSKVGFGGGQNVTLSMMAYFKKSGRPIVLVDSRRKTLFRDRAEELTRDTIEFSHFGRIAHSEKPSMSMSLYEILFFPFFVLINSTRLFKYIRSHTHETFRSYVCTKKGLPYAYILKIAFGIPYVFHVHNTYPTKGLILSIMTFFLKKAQSNLCVSKYVQRNIKLKNTILLYNPISKKKVAHRTYPPEPFVIVYLGSLLKWKGIDTLVEGFNKLQSDQTRLWIVGEGDHKEHLQSHCKNDRIRFMGHVEHFWETHHAEVGALVLPSHEPEAFGMVLAEAMSFGIPVFASNLGAAPEIVGEQNRACLFPAKDAEELSHQMNRLLTNTPLYALASENVRAQSMLFSYERFEKILQDIFPDTDYFIEQSA